MHSRKKGTSGSRKPLVSHKPSWVRHTQKEAEMLITKLAKEGKSPSQIGTILRDSYGVPDAKELIGKAIVAFLREKKLSPELPEDLHCLLKRSIEIRSHLNTHKQDMTAFRGLQLTEAKIKRLAKYYKRTEKIPRDWKYDAENVRLAAE